MCKITINNLDKKTYFCQELYDIKHIIMIFIAF